MSSDTFLYNSLFFKIGIREDFTNNHLWTYKTFGKKKLDFMGAARKKCWAWKTSPWLFAKKIIRGLNRLHKSPKVQPPPFSDLPPPFSALPPPFFGHLGVFLVAGEKNEFFSPLSLTKKTTFLARRFVKKSAALFREDSAHKKPRQSHESLGERITEIHIGYRSNGISHR